MRPSPATGTAAGVEVGGSGGPRQVPRVDERVRLRLASDPKVHRTLLGATFRTFTRTVLYSRGPGLPAPCLPVCPVYRRFSSCHRFILVYRHYAGKPGSLVFLTGGAPAACPHFHTNARAVLYC